MEEKYERLGGASQVRRYFGLGFSSPEIELSVEFVWGASFS